MRRSVPRKVVCWTLFVGWLSAQSLAAAGNRPVVGKVVWCTGASLNGAAVSDESTIVAGDLLSTEKGGDALVNFLTPARTTLSEQTAVRFESASERAVARISSGTLLTETLGEGAAVVETAKYKIEPAEPGKATYLVALKADKSTVVAARLGYVSITEIKSGLRYILPEGQYATIADSASGVPKQSTRPSKPGVQPAAELALLGWSIAALPAGSSVSVPAVAGSSAAGSSLAHTPRELLRPKPSPH